MTGMSPRTPTQHHAISSAKQEHQEKNIKHLTRTLRNFTNPFSTDSNDLFNLVTKVIMPENVKSDLCRQSEIGSNLFETFVSECIKSGDTNLWSTMKKQNLNTWKTTGKKLKVMLANKVVELQEDRSLFACMMVICKSRPEINLKKQLACMNLQ